MKSPKNLFKKFIQWADSPDGETYISIIIMIITVFSIWYLSWLAYFKGIW
jgi:hypothetical protein